MYNETIILKREPNGKYVAVFTEEDIWVPTGMENSEIAISLLKEKYPESRIEVE